MLELNRVNERHPRPRVYNVPSFAGAAAGTDTFNRGGIIVTGGQGSEQVQKVTLLINTTATGATADVKADANVTTATLTIGGDTVATAASTAVVDLADGVEMTLTSTAADLIRSEGDVILLSVGSAGGGEDLSALSFGAVIETQPV